MLEDALRIVDVAWVCRPELCRKYLPAIRTCSSIPVLYDTIDLHHVRLRREAELLERFDDPVWRQAEALELACAHAADATIVVSDVERSLLESAGIRPVAVVSNIHDVTVREAPSFERSGGLIFIGGYNHTPNVDAVEWMVREIMPVVWEALPDVTLTLLGANPPERVRSLATSRVRVTGYIHDVSEFFRSARIFVAPLRFGAGVKGKIGQALEFGLPMVTTSVGAEGFGLTHRVDAMIADDARTFADATIELYRDHDLWTWLSAAAPRILEPFSSKRVAAAALDIVEQLVGAPR
jgi:glycosyltransferase involved in cell wall biosynthesis